jgi:hypothetical protein
MGCVVPGEKNNKINNKTISKEEIKPHNCKTINKLLKIINIPIAVKNVFKK